MQGGLRSSRRVPVRKALVIACIALLGCAAAGTAVEPADAGADDAGVPDPGTPGASDDNDAWVSDEKTFIYAYPDGLTDVLGQRFWNATDACCDIYNKPTDDVYFATAVLADVQSSWSVDPKRIYVFGHSNGGFMAHRLACDLSQ